MSNSIAITYIRAVSHAARAQDALRIVLVSGCAMTLVLAGRALPF